MEHLKIAAIQADLKWEDKKANIRLFEEKIYQIDASPDVIILPEMFSTGFTMNAETLAEAEDGATLQWMKNIAERTGAVICGSIIIREDRKYYNRLLWVQPDKSYAKYDKRHLFNMAKENDIFSAGEEKLIVEWKGWKICPQVCYDLRFPVWNRNTEDYDILINIANWPEKRSYPWKTLLKARAIENQAFVVGVNRVGEDGNGIYYSGDSAIMDPLGEVITEKADMGYILWATLEKETLNEIRRKFPFLKDRDNFEIIK